MSQDTQVIEFEDTLDNFSKDSGAPQTFKGVDSSDEFKSQYKGSDNVTRKGVVASKWDNTGALVGYVDNDMGNISIKSTPVNTDHAARLQDITDAAQGLQSVTDVSPVTTETLVVAVGSDNTQISETQVSTTNGVAVAILNSTSGLTVQDGSSVVVEHDRVYGSSENTPVGDFDYVQKKYVDDNNAIQNLQSVTDVSGTTSNPMVVTDGTDTVAIGTDSVQVIGAGAVARSDINTTSISTTDGTDQAGITPTTINVTDGTTSAASNITPNSVILLDGSGGSLTAGSSLIQSSQYNLPLTDSTYVQKKYVDDQTWVVKTETSDFTAEAWTIHLVETSTVDIVCTLPDAVDENFLTRIYKVTDVSTPDVTCVTVSSQLIAGSTTQLLQGLSEGFYAVAHTDHYEVIQDNRGGTPRKLSESTTVISGYEISQNTGDTNKIDIGSGVFSEALAGVDPTPPANSDLSSPDNRIVKTDAVVALTITGLATDGFTVLQVTPAGAIVQTLNDVPSQEDENINPKIAVIVHSGGVVLSAESWWTVGQNPSKRVSWLLSKLGVLKEGITMFGAGVGNLQFAHDAGTISYAGADGEKSPNNPDEQPVAASDPVAGFILAKQDAFINFAQTVIDPTQIDVAGTLTALTGIDKVSIQRIFINLNGTFSVQYGQNGYATIAEGLTALAEGTDTFIRFNVISKVSRICAYLIVDRACTDLTNTAQAQFVQTGLLESDGSLSSTSELVTILKALQNGNDAGGLGIVNLGTTAIGISNPAYDFVVSDDGASGFEFAPGLIADQATLLTIDRNANSYIKSATFCTEWSVWTGATGVSSRALAMAIDSDGVITSTMSISDITADKTLVTKEYVDRVEAAGWVQIGTSGVYYCRKNGIVYVKLVNVTSNFTASQLPAGYRPAETLPYAIYGFGAGSPGGNWVQVDTAGVVSNNVVGVTLVGVISFPAEQ